ncbi:MAG: DNA-directed RNA polymerase subunit omega [Chitinophagales bacterium]|nr:DNA-directed RNA polymerase subunit omega [Chitinophagales bacterium]MDW8392925.1 DNA-directed RNA polymerase subunit omega [Chitinophagales bacterium]
MSSSKTDYNTQGYLVPRNLVDLQAKTGNVYEAIVIIAKRANQIANKLREELHSKLEEFNTVTDNLEEVHENREQIELSRMYERMPNPALLATQEFLEGKIYFRNPQKENEPELTPVLEPLRQNGTGTEAGRRKKS